MKIKLSDITFRYTRGQGPGGQHKNKTDSCVTARHVPTGIEVTIDGRSQHQNKRAAIKRLEWEVLQLSADQRAERKKVKRDHAIKNGERVRTYDFSRNLVTDHRTGKTAPIKEILDKARLEKLR